MTLRAVLRLPVRLPLLAPMRAPLLLLAALLIPAAAAQPSFTIAGAVGVPQGEFDDALGSVGGGVTGTLMYRVPRTAVAVGVEGTAMLYGYENRREPFSLTIPDVAVDVSTSNNVAQGLAVLRLQLPDGSVRPYLDGVAGVNYLWTQTTVGDDDDNVEIASSTNFDDLTFAYGGGLGVQARLAESLSESGRPRAILLDARVRYLVGGEATYLGRGDIDRFSDGTIRVFPRRSKTTMLIPQLGVTFEL